MEHVQDQLPAGFSSQMGSFAIVPMWIFEHELKPADFKVWISIRSFCGSNGVCWPKATKIAERAHVSVSAVHHSVGSLRSKGLLKTRQKLKDDGSLAYLIYTVPDLDSAKYAVTALEPKGHKGSCSNEQGGTTSKNKASSLVAPPCSNEQDPLAQTSKAEVINRTNQNRSSSGASYRDRIAVLTGADDDGIDLVIEKIKGSTRKPVRNLGALIRSISDQDIVDHHASLAPAPAVGAVSSAPVRRCPVHPGSTSWPCASCLGDLKAGEDPFAAREDLRPDGWFEAHPLGERFRGGAVGSGAVEPEPEDVWVSPVWDGDTEAFVAESDAGGHSLESAACSNPMCHDGYVHLGASGRRVCAVCGGEGSVGARSVASLVGSLADSFGSIA